MEKYEKVVKSLTKAQKKAILLFGKTDNIYDYRDELEQYKEPFLWSDSRYTIESAPDAALSSLRRKKLLIMEFSEYTGAFWFLTGLGKEVLYELQLTDPIIQNAFITRIKEDNRKARETKV